MRHETIVCSPLASLQMTQNALCVFHLVLSLQHAPCTYTRRGPFSASPPRIVILREGKHEALIQTPVIYIPSNLYHIFTVSLTSCKRSPLVRGRGHLLNFLIGQSYCNSSLLNGHLATLGGYPEHSFVVTRNLRWR